MHKSHSKRHHGGKRHKKGGQYSSAATYGNFVNGNVNDQFSRVFDTNGPYGQIPGNVIIGAQGQNAGYPPSVSAPSIPPLQKAGKRSKRRRGGNIGSIINQAIVPFGILGLQQTYKKKRYGGKKSRKNYKNRS